MSLFRFEINLLLMKCRLKLYFVFSGGDQPVNFLTKSQGSQRVRRLSTVSSVTKPPHYTLTTQWLWYYKGDQGNWVEYGQLVSQTAVSA